MVATGPERRIAAHRATERPSEGYSPGRPRKTASRDDTPRVLYSEVLGLYYELRDDGSVSFEDGVDYFRREVQNLRGAPAELVKQVHAVKTVFDGEVVK